MSASMSSRQAAEKVADVLAAVRRSGVRLWTENGQLRYSGPKGAMTPAQIECLRASKSQIVALLEDDPVNSGAVPALVPRARREWAPMAFSQQVHWNLYRLRERSARRQIASALRLSGRLHLDALDRSIAEIVRRHDALRTRIIIVDGVPVQRIFERIDYEFTVHSLMELRPDLQQSEIVQQIEQHILEPIDVGRRPLFGLRLLQLKDDEHVLIVAMEHMISDAVSLDIFLRELLTAYAQAAQGRPFHLPAIPIQFADYAVWQRHVHQWWIERHAGYWKQHLANCQRLKFPREEHHVHSGEGGWALAPLQIGTDLKMRLSDWCRQRRTTVVMSVLSAYVLAVMRWCDVSDAVIQYQSDGRVTSELEGTIGYLASVLYLRVRLGADDRLSDLLNQVTEEYCAAYEHADSSYLASQYPKPEYTHNTTFNWVSRGDRERLLVDQETSLACAPVPFAHPMLKSLDVDHEPSILLYETADGIVGGVNYPLNSFAPATMERFARTFLTCLQLLLANPDERVANIRLERTGSSRSRSADGFRA